MRWPDQSLANTALHLRHWRILGALEEVPSLGASVGLGVCIFIKCLLASDHATRSKERGGGGSLLRSDFYDLGVGATSAGAVSAGAAG